MEKGNAYRRQSESTNRAPGENEANTETILSYDLTDVTHWKKKVKVSDDTFSFSTQPLDNVRSMVTRVTHLEEKFNESIIRFIP